MLGYQPTASLQDLVVKLCQAVAIDKIFLLGVSAGQLPVNSIFSPIDQQGEPATAYFLLLLTRPGELRSDDTIQDMLEQWSKSRIPVHLLVYPAKMFYQWLRLGQSFAITVIQNAPLLYNSGITRIPPAGAQLKAEAFLKQVEQARLGFERSEAFLQGAQYFISKQKYNLAAFLLHQAAEHACLSFILLHTGLRTGTHNIDKLLRYSTMIDDTLTIVFPRKYEDDIELFRLLQKAYIHSRYKEDYRISESEITILMRKVTRLCQLSNPEKEENKFRVEEESMPWTTFPGGLYHKGKIGRSSIRTPVPDYLQDQNKYENDHQYGAYR